MEETATTMEKPKPVMVVGLDDSECSFYALEWALDQFFVSNAPNSLFKLVIVHAKASPSGAMGIGGFGPGTVDVLPHIESDLKRKAARVMEKGKEICVRKSVTTLTFKPLALIYDILVNDVVAEVVEGDARSVLCQAVDNHHASVLVVGSHGYGAIKRAVLGCVSDYCAHHAHCSVMIVKTPKTKH